jgi:hypothetical protein
MLLAKQGVLNLAFAKQLILDFNSYRSACSTADLLHAALKMNRTVIPSPQDLLQAQQTDAALRELLPFTYTISQFRNRSFQERGLVAHFTPMASLHVTKAADAAVHYSNNPSSSFSNAAGQKSLGQLNSHCLGSVYCVYLTALWIHLTAL